MSFAVSSRIKPSVLSSPSRFRGSTTLGPFCWGTKGAGGFLAAEEGAGDTVLGAKKTFGIDFSDLQ